jgi:predicted AAA+ superfamily ATPase
VIDEIQKLPSLMDEVHFMIEEMGVRFLLTGSSARKLKRSHTSLMAGRAKTRRFFPFVSAEIPDFNLERALRFGTLPPAYLAKDPQTQLKSYAGDYLQEEIRAEALSRNIEGFSRFLRRAALSSGEVLNFESVANDAQLSARTIREYFFVLEDTLIGTLLQPFQTQHRKAISKGKFYFFDIGVLNALIGQHDLAPDTSAYGKALEHFIFQELYAYLSYHQIPDALTFWRSTTHQEVDFIVNGEIAIEVKAAGKVGPSDFKGLKALDDDTPMRRLIIVCKESEKRKVGKIEVMPATDFLKALWADAFLLGKE